MNNVMKTNFGQNNTQGRFEMKEQQNTQQPVAWRVFRSATEYELFTSEYNAKQRAKQLGSAAVQPLYHSLPAVALLDVLEQMQLAETEVINAKTWSAGEQAKTHCKHALTAIAVARSLLSAVQKH